MNSDPDAAFVRNAAAAFVAAMLANPSNDTMSNKNIIDHAIKLADELEVALEDYEDKFND